MTGREQHCDHECDGEVCRRYSDYTSFKSDWKGREVLRYIYERTLNNGCVSNQDIENRFKMKKQQVSYYIKNLRESGLIVTDIGLYDHEKKVVNYRHNSIRLTQQGQMEAKFIRDV